MACRASMSLDHVGRLRTSTDGANVTCRGTSLIQQISPTLGLPSTEQRELDESAQALPLEAASPAPEPNRLRRVADRVTAALGSATQVTTALTLLIDAGEKAYRAVFGG
jgi:hypothetical protein